MKRFMRICFAVSFVLFIFSCSLNDDGPNFHFKALQITEAEVPESFELNQTYQITVTYILPDGCTSFSGFEVADTDTTIRNVVVFGTVRTDQEGCTTAITETQATFNFKCLYDQPYTFRFWQGEGADGAQEYFEVVVPVN
ncbi:MAG: hypothetical protein Mars2KO_13640 [Maribacter sp.]